MQILAEHAVKLSAAGVTGLLRSVSVEYAHGVRQRIGARGAGDASERLVGLEILRGQGVRTFWDNGLLRLDSHACDTRGGGLFVANEARMHIAQCWFGDNSASKDGGALYCYNVDTVEVRDSVFVCNSAKWGGAICCEQVRTVLIERCVFIRNNACAMGGAIAASHCEEVQIWDNEFCENYSGRHRCDVELHKCSVAQVGRV